MRKPPLARSTRQKRVIREVFERAGRPLSTEEILAEAKGQVGTLGIATVYRSIRALLDEGWLAPVEVPGRSPYYERSGKEHHHHFLCTECERAYELAGCTTETRPLPAGFRAQGHDVTIYGTCPACSRVASG